MATMESKVYVEPIPSQAIHPGSILLDELEDRGITQKDFAKAIGMEASHFNSLVKGKRRLTADIALKLEQELGIRYIVWMNMQNDYDRDVELIKQRGVEEEKCILKEKELNGILNIKEIYKRFEIHCIMAIDRIKKLSALADLDDYGYAMAQGFYKKSDKLQIDDKNAKTWLFLAYHKAKAECLTKEFNKDGIDDVAKTISKIANEGKLTIDIIKSELASIGISYIHVEKLEKTPIDAYSVKFGGRPVVVVTYRYNDMDKLAFDVLHELGHLKLHITDSEIESFVKFEDNDSSSVIEDEANEFARNCLIPADVWKKIIKSRSNSLIPSSIHSIVAREAEKYGISKTIAVARYKRESGDYVFRGYKPPVIV